MIMKLLPKYQYVQEKKEIHYSKSFISSLFLRAVFFFFCLNILHNAERIHIDALCLGKDIFNLPS